MRLKFTTKTWNRLATQKRVAQQNRRNSFQDLASRHSFVAHDFLILNRILWTAAATHQVWSNGSLQGDRKVKSKGSRNSSGWCGAVYSITCITQGELTMDWTWSLQHKLPLAPHQEPSQALLPHPRSPALPRFSYRCWNAVDFSLCVFAVVLMRWNCGGLETVSECG